jgi:hypothetical protein
MEIKGQFKKQQHYKILNKRSSNNGSQYINKLYIVKFQHIKYYFL